MRNRNRIKRTEVNHDQLELLETLEKNMGLESDYLRLRDSTSNDRNPILGMDWSESAIHFNFPDLGNLITLDQEVYYG